MTRTDLQQIGDGAARTLIRQLVVGLFQLVIIVLIARFFGPEGNGKYAVALLLPAMLATFLNLGVAPANVYFIGAGKVSVKTAWHSTLKLFLVLSILGILIGSSILALRAEQWFPSVHINVLYLALLAFPAQLLMGFTSSIFQGLQKFKTYNLVLLVQPLLFLVLISILLASGNREIIWLIAIYLASTVLAILVSLYFLTPLLKNSDVIEGESDYGLSIVGYGYKAHLSNILAFVNYKADILLVNFFINPAAAGIYVIAVQLVERLWLVSQSLSTVLLPKLSELSKEESKRRVITPLFSRWVLFITLVAGILMALIAKPLIHLVFGEAYFATFMPLLLLLPGIIVCACARIMANDLAARGKPELNTYVSLIAVVVNIVLNIVLIPKYGLIGAAIATSICYFTIFVLTLFIYCRLTGTKWINAILLTKHDMANFKMLLSKKNRA